MAEQSYAAGVEGSLGSMHAYNLYAVDVGDVELTQPFINYLPGTFPTSMLTYQSFDRAGLYSFHLSAPWMLLAVNGNTWTDPGRCWEPELSGGTGATAGHVLSRDCNQGLDMASVTGDRYFVYMR